MLIHIQANTMSKIGASSQLRDELVSVWAAHIDTHALKLSTNMPR